MGSIIKNLCRDCSLKNSELRTGVSLNDLI
jgi:hypothetical protein